MTTKQAESVQRRSVWRRVAIVFGAALVVGAVWEATRSGDGFKLVGAAIGGVWVAYGWFGPGFIVKRLASRSTWDQPWEDYRRRRWIFIVSWLCGFPVAAAALALANALGSPPWSLWLVGPVFAWMLVTWYRFSMFACPWCGKPFFVTLIQSNPFADRCLHCNAEKWTVPSGRDSSMAPPAPSRTDGTPRAHANTDA